MTILSLFPSSTCTGPDPGIILILTSLEAVVVVIVKSLMQELLEDSSSSPQTVAVNQISHLVSLERCARGYE